MDKVRTRSQASEVDDLDHECECGVGRDETRVALRTIGVIRRASQLGFLSLLELADAFVPPPDDLLLTEHELEGLAARNRRVKDGAIRKRSSVMNLDPAAFRDARASSLVERFNLERHICICRENKL